MGADEAERAELWRQERRSGRAAEGRISVHRQLSPSFAVSCPQQDSDLVSELRIALPSWIGEAVGWGRVYRTDHDRMRLAITLSRENVLRGTGGPFGAAVFDGAGRVVAVGVNLVVAHHNSMLHAEMVALMMAEQRVGSHSLRDPAHEIATSCDPCAMCLGSILWSGVRRLLAGADREDAHALGFDEGPVFEESYQYLETRGIQSTRGILRHEARAVLELYRDRGGPIYNG